MIWVREDPYHTYIMGREAHYIQAPQGHRRLKKSLISNLEYLIWVAEKYFHRPI